MGIGEDVKGKKNGKPDEKKGGKVTTEKTLADYSKALQQGNVDLAKDAANKATDPEIKQMCLDSIAAYEEAAKTGKKPRLIGAGSTKGLTGPVYVGCWMLLDEPSEKQMLDVITVEMVKILPICKELYEIYKAEGKSKTEGYGTNSYFSTMKEHLIIKIKNFFTLITRLYFGEGAAKSQDVDGKEMLVEIPEGIDAGCLLGMLKYMFPNGGQKLPSETFGYEKMVKFKTVIYDKLSNIEDDPEAAAWLDGLNKLEQTWRSAEEKEKSARMHFNYPWQAYEELTKRLFDCDKEFLRGVEKKRLMLNLPLIMDSLTESDSTEIINEKTQKFGNSIGLKFQYEITGYRLGQYGVDVPSEMKNALHIDNKDRFISAYMKGIQARKDSDEERAERQDIYEATKLEKRAEQVAQDKCLCPLYSLWALTMLFWDNPSVLPIPSKMDTSEWTSHHQTVKAWKETVQTKKNENTILVSILRSLMLCNIRSGKKVVAKVFSEELSKRSGTPIVVSQTFFQLGNHPSCKRAGPLMPNWTRAAWGVSLLKMSRGEQSVGLSEMPLDMCYKQYKTDSMKYIAQFGGNYEDFNKQYQNKMMSRGRLAVVTVDGACTTDYAGFTNGQCTYTPVSVSGTGKLRVRHQVKEWSETRGFHLVQKEVNEFVDLLKLGMDIAVALFDSYAKTGNWASDKGNKRQMLHIGLEALIQAAETKRGITLAGMKESEFIKPADSSNPVAASVGAYKYIGDMEACPCPHREPFGVKM